MRARTSRCWRASTAAVRSNPRGELLEDVERADRLAAAHHAWTVGVTYVLSRRPKLEFGG